MAKTKMQIEGAEKTSSPPIVEERPKPPDKMDGPQPDRHAAQPSPEEASTSERAQVMRTMQGAVGNARVGEMMTASSSGVIQQKGKGEKEKGEKGKQEKPLLPITTPLAKEVPRKPSGEAVLESGGVAVTVRPDKQSKKKIIVEGQELDAHTSVAFNWHAPKNYETEDGKITRFDSVPQPTMEIQTTYGPGATPESKSAYGKGTTPEDIKARKTTLGYHEGSHGLDYIQYVKDNPVPQFQGRVGMTVKEYKQADADYNQAMQKYYQDLKEFSKQRTDCVGVKLESCE